MQYFFIQLDAIFFFYQAPPPPKKIQSTCMYICMRYPVFGTVIVQGVEIMSVWRGGVCGLKLFVALPKQTVNNIFSKVRYRIKMIGVGKMELWRVWDLYISKQKAQYTSTCLVGGLLFYNTRNMFAFPVRQGPLCCNITLWWAHKCLISIVNIHISIDWYPKR